MFDLIEEALLTPEPEPKVASAPTAPQVAFSPEPLVFSMPEKFRKKKKKKSKLPLIIAASVIALLLIGGTVAILLILQTPQKPLTPLVQEPVQQQPVAVPVAEPTTTDSASSTPASVLPDEQRTAPQDAPATQQATSTDPIAVTPPDSTNTTPSTPTYSAGADTDGDSLTDNEERLYNTDPSKPDTDSDQFTDGDEILRLYDPTRPQGARLETSGLINTFTNQTFKYSLFYPSSWIAKAVNVAEKEIVISSATGEFFSVIVQDNPDHLSALDWYSKVVSPQVNTAKIQTLTSDTWVAAMSEDKMSVYITKNTDAAKNGAIVVVIKYNPNTKNEINFSSTMQMMLKSFVFTDLSFTRK